MEADPETKGKVKGVIGPLTEMFLTLNKYLETTSIGSFSSPP